MSERPSTHPALYHRAVDGLKQQAADVLFLLSHLDPADAYFAAATLDELLEDIAIQAQRIIDDMPVPRTRVDVPTGGRL